MVYAVAKDDEVMHVIASFATSSALFKSRVAVSEESVDVVLLLSREPSCL